MMMSACFFCVHLFIAVCRCRRQISYANRIFFPQQKCFNYSTVLSLHVDFTQLTSIQLQIKRASSDLKNINTRLRMKNGFFLTTINSFGNEPKERKINFSVFIDMLCLHVWGCLQFKSE